MKNIKNYERYVKHFEQLTRIDYSERITLRNLMKMVIRQELVLPDIQREEVWNNEQKSNFLGTVFVIPEYIQNDIMPRITVMTDGKRCVLVEGLQRLLSLLSFFLPCEEFQKDIQRSRQKFKGDFFLLRMTDDTPPLKFSFSSEYKLPGTGIEDFTGCTYKDIPQPLMKKVLNLETIINKVQVPVENFDQEVRQVFLMLNTNEKVNRNEINKCLFLGTPCYDEIANITYDYLLPTIEYRDKRYSAINAVIDTYSLYVGEYTGGYGEKRTSFLKKYQNDLVSISCFKKDFLRALNIAKQIFPEGYCFSQYDDEGWKKCTTAAMIPWMLGIHNLLVAGTQPEDFLKNREKIMSLWKGISIPTGRDTAVVRFTDEQWAELNQWTEKMTNHTNNKRRVEGRIKIIQLLLEYAIQ